MTEVVAALIWDKDKFMICQRPTHKARGLLWEFVGGKVEPGETKEQALIRECQEELAVTLSIGDVFMDYTLTDITLQQDGKGYFTDYPASFTFFLENEKTGDTISVTKTVLTIEPTVSNMNLF